VVQQVVNAASQWFTFITQTSTTTISASVPSTNITFRGVARKQKSAFRHQRGPCIQAQRAWWGLGQSPQEREKYAENLIGCPKFHTVQRKKNQCSNLGGGHVPLSPPLPYAPDHVTVRIKQFSILWLPKSVVSVRIESQIESDANFAFSSCILATLYCESKVCHRRVLDCATAEAPTGPKYFKLDHHFRIECIRRIEFRNLQRPSILSLQTTWQ